MTSPNPAGRPALCSTGVLLTRGGDERITLTDGRNRYGHSPFPRADEIAFGSSTASTISAPAFAAADALRSRLEADLREASPAAVYRRHADRLRADLRRLLELGDEVDILLAASGTDVHLVAASLTAGADARPLSVISVEANETGGGLDHALAGRHFGEVANGVPVMKGALIAGGTPIRRYAFAVRDAQGEPLDAEAVEAAIGRLVDRAMADDHQVLLVVTDVTKTGLIAPRLDIVERLRRRWTERLTVLVDACQFRLSTGAIKAYLAWNCMVAVTGSKFLTGPAFSGALLIPPTRAERLSRRAPPEGLLRYGARAEWPRGWTATERMPDGDNFGLLLRWRAALTELAAFLAVTESQVAGRLDALAAGAQAVLARTAWAEPLPTRALDRGALGCGEAWDKTPTIFAFRVRHPDGAPGFLDIDALARARQALAAPSGGVGPIRLGQPVSSGHGQGALRLAISARHVVQARDEAAIADIVESMGEAFRRLGEHIHGL